MQDFPEAGYKAPIEWGSEQIAEEYAEKCCQLFENTGRRVIKNPHLLFSWAAALAAESRLIDVVTSYIGNNVAIENTFLIVKAPHDGFVVPPHQDGINLNLKLNPQSALSAWLAISEATVDNGCVCVYPFSHAGGYKEFKVSETHTEGQSNRRPLEVVVDNEGEAPVPIPLGRGQGCLFSVCLVHSSGPNCSHSCRIGMNVRFVAPNGVLHRSAASPPLLLVRGSDDWSSKWAEWPKWEDAEGWSRLKAIS